MSYYGRSADNINNVIKLDNITFNGGTTYALTQNGVAFVPNNSSSLLISIDGVVQQGNFTVNSSNIVFNFSPTSSNTCNWILHIGVGVAYVPAASSITKDKTDFVSTSSSAGLTIKGDGTTDGYIGLSCSQNSHAVKIKAPSHSSSQSYTLTLPGTAPAADKMLQTDGSGNLSFVDAPSSGEYVKIANVNTSSGTSMSFNDCFSTTYRTYLITFQFENDRNGNQLWFRFQADDDSTFDSNYRYASHQINNGGTESSITHTSNSYWRMTGGTAGGNTAVFGGCFGYMYVHNPYTIATGQEGAGNIYRTGWNAHYCEYDDTGNVSNIVTTGMLEQNSYNVAGVRFMPSANYLGKRNATVWGLKEY